MSVVPQNDEKYNIPGNPILIIKAPILTLYTRSPRNPKRFAMRSLEKLMFCRHKDNTIEACELRV